MHSCTSSSICWSTSCTPCSTHAFAIEMSIVDDSAAIAPTAPVLSSGSFRRLLRNPVVVAGAAILTIILLMGLAAPWLGTMDPAAINPAMRNKLPGFEEILRNADGSQTAIVHRMGTDTLGRDVYSR